MKYLEIYERVFENTSETDPIHIHGHLEIFTLLEGQLDYMIDGVIYQMKVGDVAVVSAGAPHAKKITHSGHLRFAVINVENGFFTEAKCPEYSEFFAHLDTTEHLIKADSAKEIGLHSAFARLSSYTEGYRHTETPIAACTVLEILYLIAGGSFTRDYSEHPTVRRIIEYIGKHYRESISLADISSRLYLSKYYVSRLFKAHTGMTVMEYLTGKRLYEFDRLINAGETMTAAALSAGFPDYTSFYNAYKKAHGVSPRKHLKCKE